ncbi:hypothetical protein [Acidipropionibacterium jensenii]|uniref:hypothetical protein n=1 Tax=Acidipropionibacterium jensenii TaxID=1749 RepID=UPI000F83B7A6|nr:hypothetical protein [Acidipropionibacterium jensenii]MDN5976371.1 hypothetical protein [Acidipropionibacterium jensenii]MDN6425657.1 hypothetical protein [Acidipropionibacterium jensenii]MDN6440569.1 hypothetical protein [Acidipropionibacterium jensenii]MDN6479437.1 hypothetical protein [Acidipropionibacterium jensenii]MDN6511826.1 hypothetical protein [Acidipropionibacterium jensenii]
MAETPPHINDAEATPAIWLICGIAAVVVGIVVPLVVALWRRHRFRAEKAEGDTNEIEPVRSSYLNGLEAAEKAWRGGDLGDADALEHCSGAVREFVGVVTDTDTAALTLTELRSRAMLRPELKPVADLVGQGYQTRFAGAPSVDGAVAAAFAQARKVIAEWD